MNPTSLHAPVAVGIMAPIGTTIASAPLGSRRIFPMVARWNTPRTELPRWHSPNPASVDAREIELNIPIIPCKEQGFRVLHSNIARELRTGVEILSRRAIFPRGPDCLSASGVRLWTRRPKILERSQPRVSPTDARKVCRRPGT